MIFAIIGYLIITIYCLISISLIHYKINEIYLNNNNNNNNNNLTEFSKLCFIVLNVF